jgi:hypothetical protein
LWQNEQRNISSVPVLFFTRLYSFVNPLYPAPMRPLPVGGTDRFAPRLIGN